MTAIPRVLSYGGGLDSFAMLLEAIRRNDRPDVAVFCDVADPAHGDPGEWPSTYRHLCQVVLPLCAREGIEFIWLDTERYPVRGGTDGQARSLFAWLEARKQIPVAGPNRICTRVAKVERFEAWARDRFQGEPIEVWVGFEAGEEARAAKDPNAGSGTSWRRNRFPLIEWSLCRCRCEQIVRESGYPVPRKSACVFCPYASKGDWQTFAAELLDQFARVVELEANKPPTKRNGLKLSLMGYSTRMKNKLGRAYVPPALPKFIQGTYRPRPKPCKVCGAAQRATKATGCSYLADGAATAA